jgi:peptidoglycan hydrolase-like protein with peptidoglycan-binding domain
VPPIARLAAIGAAAVLVAGLTGCGNSSSTRVAGTTVTATTVRLISSGATTAASATAGNPTTGATTAAPPPTPVVKVPLARTLAEGMKGDDVAYLQQRLTDLKFDPGPIDGRFGKSVTMAVWAFQVLTGLTGDQEDGKVTPDLWSKMQDPFAIAQQQSDGGPNHLEVDIPKQVAILWANGQPRLITHISTGSGKNWCENGVCGVAVTPAGVYKFDRRYSGWRQSDLGLLYNPVYFNYGIAVHGAIQVPKYPASHGCIRIPMHIAQYFPTLVKAGDPVFVFDGVKPPQEYGSPPPPPNSKDPNYVPTTLPEATLVPTTTTVPKTTTTKAGATTTTKAGATTVPATTATTTPVPST